ncbi:MAG: hypothetical protein GQ574_17550 [Crocinitomix sp.]|nr:hypothetical protein [Crocinitomix sp.]
MRKAILLFLILGTLSGYAQRFNEVCASNTSVFEHITEGFTDWIEFHNSSEELINMEGWFLTNDINLPEMWTFPAIEIVENGYYLIAANEGSINAETFPYSLSKNGVVLYLLNPSGVLTDSIVQPKLRVNNSYGRLADKWFFFESPSPNGSNNVSTGYNGYANLPTVNRSSGLYPKGTNIVIRAEEADAIYYSLNGTNPILGSLYSAPFVLNETIYIKAIGSGDSLIDSRPIERTYFTDVSHDLRVVNLTVDSLELFDELIGIYVKGPDADEAFPFSGANFWDNKEIHAYYEYFDEDMRLLESLDCDIKIHGGSGSRTKPMKSFQIQAKDSYDQSEFRQVYFEEKPINHFKRLVLRNSGNDNCGTCVKDGTLHKYFIESELNVDLLGFRPVVVYINGTYWGIHNMREKVGRYYLESNYGVDPNEVNLLERGAIIPVSGEATDFIALKDYAIASDLGIESNYKWVADRLDINSFVDYFIIELYANNRDWPNNNLKVWNAPSHPKWRYICYDLDATFNYLGSDPEDFYSLAYILNNLSESNPHVALLKALLENENFKNYFINRYADLLNTIFRPERIFHRYEMEKELVSSDMTRHYEKWCGPMAQWDDRFIGIRGFLDSRVGIIREELSEVFELPEAVDVVFDVFPTGAGIVTVNSIELDRCPQLYFYYPSNEITISVVPAQDAVFKYWENTVTGAHYYSPSIKYDPTFGDHLVAVFSPSDQLFNLSLSPNPTTLSTRLNFSLPRMTDTEIHISTPDGRTVAKIEKYGTLNKGTHWVNIDMSGFPTGIYYISLVTAYGVESIKSLKI